MAAVTVRSDFEAQENNAIVHLIDYSVKHNFYVHLEAKKFAHDSLYYDICFIAVVWNWTFNISKVCLYILSSRFLSWVWKALDPKWWLG